MTNKELNKIIAINKCLEKRVSRLEKMILPKSSTKIDFKMKNKIRDLRNIGHSYRSIEALTGVSFSSCRRIVKEVSK